MAPETRNLGNLFRSGNHFLPVVKNWWWFIYAVAVTLTLIAAFVFEFIQNSEITFLWQLGMSFNFVSLLAFYGLGLEKPFLNKFFWRFLFFFQIFISIIYTFVDYRYHSNNRNYPPWYIAIGIIYTVFFILYYVGFFNYSFKSAQIWQTPEDSNSPETAYPNSRKNRIKRFKNAVKQDSLVCAVIICLTFIPFIIQNNRHIHTYSQYPENEKQLFDYRKQTIPELRDFDRLFPNYTYELSHDLPFNMNNLKNEYVFDPNSSGKLELMAGLDNQYLLVMDVEIVFAYIEPGTGKVLYPGSNKEPKFSLWLVDEVSVPWTIFEERFAHPYKRSFKKLSSEEWKRLVDANGDFSAIGINLDKNSPVPNFKYAYRNNR